MSYSHTDFATAKAALAARLGDSGKVYWVDAELGSLLQESLRTWAAHTAYWRERVTLTTKSATPFYDLSSAVAQTGLMDYNLTDRNLVNDMEYALLEPITTAWPTWSGTSMFVMSDLVDALERRRNQFLKDTGAVLGFATLNQPSPPIGRVLLADTVIDVVRLSWIDTSGNSNPLTRTNEADSTAFLYGWSANPNTPVAFSLSVTPPLFLQVVPPPLASGTLSIATVSTGPALNVSSGVLLKVPDNFAWALKWGALAELLSRDGPSRDPLRARYAESRYLQGVELARSSPVALNVQINGVDYPTSSLYDLDRYRPAWQSSSSQGAASEVAIAGRNLLAVSPYPAGGDSIALDLARNAPVPANGGDQLQVGREELGAILDYAVHLASFKMGGAEFAATSPLLDRFLAAVRVSLDRSPWRRPGMARASGREWWRNPRRISDTALEPAQAILS